MVNLHTSTHTITVVICKECILGSNYAIIIPPTITVTSYETTVISIIRGLAFFDVHSFIIVSCIIIIFNIYLIYHSTT